MALNGRQWLVAVISIIGAFTTSSLYGVLAPFYPDEARHKENSNLQIGFVFSMYAILGICSSPIVGYLLSKGVSSKTITVIALITGGGFFATLGLLDKVPEGLPFFVANIAVRIFQTCGTSICQPCFYSIVATELHEYRNVAVATLETMFGLGMMAGPALGGILYEIGGYPLPCYIFGGIVVFVGIIALLFLPRTEISPKTTSTISWKSLDIHLVFDFLAIVCAISIMCFNDISLSGELSNYELSHSTIGLVFLACASVYAVSSIGWGSIVKKVDDSRYLVVIGAILTCFAAILMRPIELIGITITLPLQILAQCLIGLGTSAIYVCSTLHGMHYAVHRLGFPDDISTHGFISGFFMTAMFLGCFIGPVLGGLLLDLFSYGTTFFICACWSFLTVFMIIVILYVDSRNKHVKSANCQIEQGPPVQSIMQ